MPLEILTNQINEKIDHFQENMTNHVEKTKSLFEISNSCSFFALFVPFFTRSAPHRNHYAACRAQKKGRKSLKNSGGRKIQTSSNKAAGARARKASLDLEKLLKEFRKKSLELQNKM